MPSSRRPLRLDDVDPQAVLLGDAPGPRSARTSGVTSLAERFESARARFAPSPMIDPALRRLACSGCGIRAGRDEDQLVECRRRVLDVVAVERFGSNEPSTTPRATSSATARAPPSRTPASGEIQIASVFASRPPRRRSAGAADRTTVSRSSFVGLAGTDREQPAGRQLARRGDAVA